MFPKSLSLLWKICSFDICIPGCMQKIFISGYAGCPETLPPDNCLREQGCHPTDYLTLFPLEKDPFSQLIANVYRGPGNPWWHMAAF